VTFIPGIAAGTTAAATAAFAGFGVFDFFVYDSDYCSCYCDADNPIDHDILPSFLIWLVL